MAGIAKEMTRNQKIVEDQNKIKNDKVQEGTKYVKEAREDLQKICRVLLQKKLENEDLLAEVSLVNVVNLVSAEIKLFFLNSS